MKVIVKDKAEKKELPFPKLMISPNGKIVLFSKPNIGVMIFDRVNAYRTLCFIEEKDWHMDSFTDFHGEVTLSNGEADD